MNEVERKKMGRPTEVPKNHRESFRMSDEDMKKLKVCMDKTGMSKTDIIRAGIEAIYQKVR